MEQAAQLHDVGKIGIPDAILLKQGKLEPEEFETIKKHCGFGKRVILPLPDAEWQRLKDHTSVGSRIMDIASSPVISLAARIAVTHHEKWDGAGYPLGLAGEDIPIEGRIVAVADVYDALSSARPYKPPFPREKCLAIMQEQRGTHFDPSVLDAFVARIDDIVCAQIEYADLA
jgi:putative two-component system response regulator